MARQPNAQPVVTFSPAELQAVIQAAISEHEASKASKAKAETSGEMEKATVKAFRRAGFKDVELTPRVNIKTFNLWLQEGRRPKEGERAVAIKGMRLFHVSQTRELTADDADMIAAKAAKGLFIATADKLAKPSPVEPPKPAVKAAKASKAKSAGTPQTH